MTALILCGLFSAKDAWVLKPQLAPSSKTTWAVSGPGTVGGEGHDAKFDLVETVLGESAAKGQPVKLSMENVLVDGTPMDGREMTGTVTSTNLISAAAGMLDVQRS